MPMEQSAAAQQGRVITKGSLKDFATVDVLQALSLSRQHTSVELYTEDGKPAGRVVLKAGMVLDASVAGSSLRGLSALRELLGMPLHSFQVERLPVEGDYPVPIGRLSSRLFSQSSDDVDGAPANDTRRSDGTRSRTVSRADTSVSRSASELRQAHLSAVPNPPRVAKIASVPPPDRSAMTAKTSTIAIASPKGGCGKTTISLNLAVSLARGGLRVVLVDADPNGDILSAIGARTRAKVGVFDALSDDADASSALMDTAIPGLRVVPAMGQNVPASLRGGAPDAGLWRGLLDSLSKDADLVLVDVPAGMFGVSAEVISACSHILGVLQAEVISRRSFEMFQRGLDALPSRPDIIGVILNMFQRTHSASVSVLVDASQELPEKWLFETTLPRNEVFLDATEQGMPVSLTDGDAAAFVAVLFDALSSELRDRLKMAREDTRARPQSFLL